MKKCNDKTQEMQKTRESSIHAHIRAYQRALPLKDNREAELEKPAVKIMTVPALMEYLQTLEDGTVIRVELEMSGERNGSYGR